MNYLNSLWIFFLIYCVYFSIKTAYETEKNKDMRITERILIMVLSLLFGGLWIFLLYKIIG